MSTNVSVEEEQILEEEHFDDADDSISINGSETDVMFEDALLDFDHNYPPLDKWTRNHPKDQILGDPQAGIMTRAQLHARNEVLNNHQEFCMFHVFISKIEPKTVKVAMEHSD